MRRIGCWQNIDVLVAASVGSKGLAPAPIAGAFSLRQGDPQLPQPYEDADCDCEKKNFEGNSERKTH